MQHKWFPFESWNQYKAVFWNCTSRSEGMRAALLHPPDRDALSGSARSCWALTGWAGWADSVWAPSWSWTWAGESVGSGDQRLEQKHRRPSWDERKRSGTAPAGKEVGRCRRSHRRSWCSRSPLLSETGPTHCCVWTQRAKSMSRVFAALATAQI